jgi:hypothetical protein
LLIAVSAAAGMFGAANEDTLERWRWKS